MRQAFYDIGGQVAEDKKMSMPGDSRECVFLQRYESTKQRVVIIKCGAADLAAVFFIFIILPVMYNIDT